MPELTYLEAIRAALHDEMEIDERVFCMGEDVGRQGGAFGATKELQQRFGVLRSIDTPVAESGIVGVADRRGDGRAAAGRRDAVRRLRVVRVRPADHLRRQDALPHRLGGAAGRALPQRRRRRRRAVPLRERRGLVPPPRRPEDRVPGDRDRRLRAAAVGHPRPQPGRVLRAQVPLPARQGSEVATGRRRRRAGAARARPASLRPGDDLIDHHLRLHRAAVAGGRRHARRPRASRSR